MATFGEIADSEKLSDMERKHLAEVLTALRRRGAHYGKNASFRDMLTAVRAAAYRAERRASVSLDERDAREMQALDATGNLILAILMHFDEVMPILRKYGKTMRLES